MSSFFDCKKCKACRHVLIIPFTNQKPTNMLFSCVGTHGIHESRLQKEKSSAFFKKVLRQSQSPAPEMAKLSPNMEKTYPFPIG